MLPPELPLSASPPGGGAPKLMTLLKTKRSSLGKENCCPCSMKYALKSRPRPHYAPFSAFVDNKYPSCLILLSQLNAFKPFP